MWAAVTKDPLASWLPPITSAPKNRFDSLNTPTSIFRDHGSLAGGQGAMAQNLLLDLIDEVNVGRNQQGCRSVALV